MIPVTRNALTSNILAPIYSVHHTERFVYEFGIGVFDRDADDKNTCNLQVLLSDVVDSVAGDTKGSGIKERLARVLR